MENSLYGDLKCLMDEMVESWAVCGGDAVDLFVERRTRCHKDIDIAVFWEDREKLLSGFLERGWRVFEPDGGLLREITGLENDLRTEDNLWCIRPETKAYRIERLGGFFNIASERKDQDALDFVELLFNRCENGEFLYKRNREIRLKDAVLKNNAGIPFLAPEMVLLYKSVFIRWVDSEKAELRAAVENCRRDFDVALPDMTPEQRLWLKAALEISFSEGHEWIRRLA